MGDRTQPEQVSPEAHQRVQDSFGRQGLMAHLGARISCIAPAPATGDRIEAVGTVLKSGRTLTVCRLAVFGVHDDGGRKLVANGQQTLVRVDRPEER
ncbi:hypothetical protein [Streptomyces rimosus]|uniref:hypothetical protein n=1 Tax=Streptomyces rimosus TaxID=1927 RepID=UPI0004C85278|nr:hypothetical protein [Streptomyces rimosus]